MANFLDANPQLAECIEHHRRRGQFVPIARNGDFAALVNRRHIDAFAVPETMTAADYVVGLELLGFRFELGHDGSGLYTLDPSFRTPEPWHKRSLDLMRAFPRSRSRSRSRIGEVIDFLTVRDRVLA